MAKKGKGRVGGNGKKRKRQGAFHSSDTGIIIYMFEGLEMKIDTARSAMKGWGA